jgi:hypothetical protein
MLKKILRASIIVTTQLFLLAILMVFITPLLLKNTDSWNHLHKVFQHFKWVLLILHLLFYAALYYLWPLGIKRICQKQIPTPNKAQMKCALNARFYLIGVFILFEILNLLRVTHG